MIESVLLSALLGPALAASDWPEEGRLVPGGPAAQAFEVRRSSELAGLYGTTPELVASLRASGLSWFESELTVAVSSRAARPVSELLALRGAGLSWGAIAGAYGFMLKDAVKEPPTGRYRREVPPPSLRERPARKRRTAPLGRESSRP